MWVVVDLGGHHRRPRDDHLLAACGEVLGEDADAVPVLLDAADGLLEEDALIPDPLRQPLRDQLGAADEAAVLRSVRDVEQPVQVRRRGLVRSRRDVEEREEQREVARLGGEDRPDPRVEQRAGVRHVQVRLLPRLEGLAVPGSGVGRRPRRGDGHRTGHLVEVVDGDEQLAHGGRVRGDRPKRAARLIRSEDAIGPVDVVAGVVGLEGADAELGGESHQVVLGGADPFPADLRNLAVADLVVQGAAADAVAGLEDQHGVPGPQHFRGCGEPGETGPDDDHIRPPPPASVLRSPALGFLGGGAESPLRQIAAERRARRRRAGGPDEPAPAQAVLVAVSSLSHGVGVCRSRRPAAS